MAFIRGLGNDRQDGLIVEAPPIHGAHAYQEYPPGVDAAHACK